jgi:mevalonate kinase
MEKQRHYAHGKLLLTSEYFVLDGAEALAIPTRFGQSLQVTDSQQDTLHWKSFDADGTLWFEGTFDSLDFNALTSSDASVGQMLSKILKTAKSLHHQRSDLHFSFKNRAIETHLTFPRYWGLGTSSTLIYNIAQLFQVNPYDLLKDTFGGSGYDIACAGAHSAIVYNVKEGKHSYTSVDMQPEIKENLYFIYLDKKQNSREGIARYREKAQKLPPQYFEAFSIITQSMLIVTDLSIFEKLIIEHEKLVAAILELPRAKSLYFNDFWGEIKSLGAWGGDFVMATSDRDFYTTKQYFTAKGFNTIIPFHEMIL